MPETEKPKETNNVSEHLKRVFERAMHVQADRVARDMVELMWNEREAELEAEAKRKRDSE